MVSDIKPPPVQLDPVEHPAFIAWRELHPGKIVPQRIEVLKGKLNSNPQKNRRLVCKLVAAAPNGSSVIGKRCRRNRGIKENFIYEKLLPELPFPSLNYYGMVDDEGSEYLWLFLEFSEGIEFSEQNEDHRRLATHWLALMHSSAFNFGATNYLPIKDANYYKKRLQVGREAILQFLRSLEFTKETTSSLNAVINQCDLLERNWNQVSEISVELPETFVHGDFIDKNMRIGNNRSEIILLPFDWGESGWGAPCTDIMHVEADVYNSLVQSVWPGVSLQSIYRSALIGKIFRSIDAINWEIPFFTLGFLERPVRRIGYYQTWLNEAIHGAGLVD